MNKKRYLLAVSGDFVPTPSNLAEFENADMKALFGEELIRVLSDAECRIFNLEVPFADTRTPVKKWGPNLIAPVRTIETYRKIKADVLGLANNHILDQGKKGLISTLSVLKKSGISIAGAGRNLEEAGKPLIFCLGKMKIGILAFCEHEFSVAGRDSCGANPFNPFCSFEQVEQVSRKTDYTVVLYHGGKEHYRYPSPDLQTVCRGLADKGADLIVCQHSHCIGCEEQYRGSVIVYGQGNFLFDRSSSVMWSTGLIVMVDRNMEVSYTPIVKKDNGVRLAAPECAQQILADFRSRSRQIQNPVFVKEKYKEFANVMLKDYLRFFSGKNNSIFFRAIHKLTGRRLEDRYFDMIYKKDDFLALRNFIECEAHRELLLQGLNNRLNID